MNREEWEAKFKSGGAWLARFHEAFARVMAGNAVVFWPVVLLAVYGLVRVFV